MANAAADDEGLVRALDAENEYVLGSTGSPRHKFTSASNLFLSSLSQVKKQIEHLELFFTNKLYPAMIKETESGFHEAQQKWLQERNVILHDRKMAEQGWLQEKQAMIHARATSERSWLQERQILTSQRIRAEQERQALQQQLDLMKVQYGSLLQYKSKGGNMEASFTKLPLNSQQFTPDLDTSPGLFGSVDRNFDLGSSPGFWQQQVGNSSGLQGNMLWDNPLAYPKFGAGVYSPVLDLGLRESDLKKFNSPEGHLKKFDEEENRTVSGGSGGAKQWWKKKGEDNKFYDSSSTEESPRGRVPPPARVLHSRFKYGGLGRI